MIRDMIGKYELLGSLGRGGFGGVYKAISLDGGPVALKILNPQLIDVPQIINKFFHEARILSKLNHPNICKLIDFFPEGPDYTIVMEYIDGTDLKELMDNQPDNLLPFKKAKAIANECLITFQYAYEMGILHRDIKPSNIMIDKNGKIIIMDFGIARTVADILQYGSDGMISVSYCPPERFNGSGEADIRSDIYSLGMVFYELFTGRMPFDTMSIPEIKLWHLNEIPVPADTYNPSLPRKISEAISTALEKDQENRFNDFRAFKVAMGL